MQDPLFLFLDSGVRGSSASKSWWGTLFVKRVDLWATSYTYSVRLWSWCPGFWILSHLLGNSSDPKVWESLQHLPWVISSIPKCSITIHLIKVLNFISLGHISFLSFKIHRPKFLLAISFRVLQKHKTCYAPKWSHYLHLQTSVFSIFGSGTSHYCCRFQKSN